MNNFTFKATPKLIEATGKRARIWFRDNFSTFLTFNVLRDMEDFSYWNKIYMTTLTLDFDKL